MTQKPLEEMIPQILKHFSDNKQYLEFNHRLYKILGGQLKTEVEQSIAGEVFNKSAFRRIIGRIPPVNILRRAADKLSKVYVDPPNRKARDPQDQDILDSITLEGGVDEALVTANIYLNSLKSFAIEPYVDHSGKHRFRTLAPHQFLPFSDDPVSPNDMTVFIKLMEEEKKVTGPKYDAEGRKVSEQLIQNVNILGLYSDTEVLVIDTAGEIREDKMVEYGIESRMNPVAMIPFIYATKTRDRLIPFPNQEGFDVSVLIPKLIADLNYAAQFMSHSIVWVKNTDLAGAELNPDAVVNLGEDLSDGASPEIGTISPSVDIPNVLQMIEFQLKSYFDSVGIKGIQSGRMSNGRDVSGIAKAIDEGDISSERKIQTELFRRVERSLWGLVSRLQIIWASENVVLENRVFSRDFEREVNVVFGEAKPFKTLKQTIEEVELLSELGLVNKKQALKIIYPQMTNEEIEVWLAEIGEAPLPGRVRSDGRFQEGDQAAQNQEPSVEPND